MGRYQERAKATASALLTGVFLAMLFSLGSAGTTELAAYDRANRGANDENEAVAKQDRQSASTLAIGDHLKVAFYSRIANGTDTSRAGVPDLTSLIERPDMTGEYVIQLDGAIFFPLLGKVSIAGQGIESLLATLERKASQVFPGATKVSIQLVEREPVYVIGDVPQPGTFKYSPGMVVLHAAALAGLRGVGPDIGARLAVAQESERFRGSQLRLADLLARRDVLIAGRIGRAPSPSEELKDLVEPSDAAARIAAASAVAELEADKLRSEDKNFDVGLLLLDQERSSLMTGLSEAETSLKFHAERYDSVSQFRNRGVMTDASYDIARVAFDSSRQHWNDLRAGLIKVNERILELRQQKSKLIADANIAREQKINELQAEIQQSAMVRSTLESLLASSGLGGTSRAEPHYRIGRRGNKGIDEFDAEKFSAVLPGDIVEVFQSSRESQLDAHKDLRIVGHGN
jgi:polysaccharide biosynthesis/export protein ExoF